LNASPATGADVHAPDKRFAPETSQVKREIWELEGKKHKERDQFHVPWQQQYYVSDYSCLTCSTQARAQVIRSSKSPGLPNNLSHCLAFHCCSPTYTLRPLTTRCNQSSQSRCNPSKQDRCTCCWLINDATWWVVRICNSLPFIVYQHILVDNFQNFNTTQPEPLKVVLIYTDTVSDWCHESWLQGRAPICIIA
jgi:hypothetical protein